MHALGVTTPNPLRLLDWLSCAADDLATALPESPSMFDESGGEFSGASCFLPAIPEASEIEWRTALPPPPLALLPDPVLWWSSSILLT